MEKNEQSASDRGGQEVAPDLNLNAGRMINGAYFSDEEVSEFSEQNFLEPFAKMEEELMPRVNALRFIRQCLPIIMDHRGEDDRKEAPWLNMWRKQISDNLRVGVILTSDNGEEEYRLPPPVGTIHTGNTGHAESIEGRYAYMVHQRRRLTSAGKFVEARMFNHIQVATDENKAHQDDLLRLMADAGYLAEYPDAAKLYHSDKETSVTRFVKANGKPVIEGQDGEPVGTLEGEGKGAFTQAQEHSLGSAALDSWGLESGDSGGDMDYD